MNKRVVLALTLMSCVCIGAMVFLFKDFFLPPVSVTHRAIVDLTEDYNADREVAEALARLKTEKDMAEIVTGVSLGIGGRQRVVALTFDGLSDRVTMQKILNLLKEHEASATFFVDGLQTIEDPQTVTDIKKENFRIENYTLSGLRQMEKLSPERLVTDFCRAQKVIAVTTDNKANLLKCNDTRYTAALRIAAKAAGFSGVVENNVLADPQKIRTQDDADTLARGIAPGSIVSVPLGVNPEPITAEEEVVDLRPAIDRRPGLKKLPKTEEAEKRDVVGTVEKLLVALKKAGYTTVYLNDALNGGKPAAVSAHTVAGDVFALLDSIKAQTLNLLGCRVAWAAPDEPVRAEEIRIILTTEPAIAFSFGGLTKETAVDDMLQRLKKLGVRGTFFVTDQEMRRYPDTVKKVIQSGQEIGVALRSSPPDTVAGARKELSDLRDLLKTRFGVQTNLVRQSSGPIPDTSREAIAAENCLLIGQAYNIVQSKHKDYQTADEVMPELFGQYVYSLARGQIAYFRLDYYTSDKLAGEVMEAVKAQKIDNIAFATVYDNPGINPRNDSQFDIKPVGDILRNKKYLYVTPAGKNTVPDRIRQETRTFTVNKDNFLAEVKKRYLGNLDINPDNSIIGFSRMYARRLDRDGAIHTNDNVVFLTFDDWGTDAAINKLLYVLRKHNVKASFFIITRTLDTSGNILRKIALDGHDIASHSDLHMPMVIRVANTARQVGTQSKSEYVEDLARSYRKLEEIAGDIIVDGKPSLTRLFRAPTLAISKMGFEALFENGFEYVVSGSYSTHDYAAQSVNGLVSVIKDGIYDSRGNVRKGAVLVMHMSDSAKFTPIALDILLTINERKADGDPSKFRLGRLSDYLKDGYAQDAPFKAAK